MHITNHVNLYSKSLCHFKNNKIVAVDGTTTAVPATAAFCTTAATAAVATVATATAIPPRPPLQLSLLRPPLLLPLLL